MKGKQLLTLSLATFALSTITYAGVVCPQVAAIQAVGLEKVLVVDHTWQASTPDSTFNTDKVWAFMIGGGSHDRVQTTDEAWVKARAAMKTLHFFSGPYQEDDSTYLCYYATDSDAMAITVSPAEEAIK